MNKHKSTKKCTVRQFVAALMYEDLMNYFDYKLSLIWLKDNKDKILEMMKETEKYENKDYMNDDKFMDQNELINSLDDKKMVQCTDKQLWCSLLYDELMYDYNNKISLIWLKQNKHKILRMIDE